MSAPRRLDAVLPHQMRFDFERQVVDDAAADMKQYIAQVIAGEGRLLLADLVDVFSADGRGWTRARTVEILQELIHDNHIIFENSNIAVKKHTALQLLLQPYNWRHTWVAHAPLVSEDRLSAARSLAAEMLAAEIPRPQNELCRLWRSHIRKWKSDLERYKPLAATGKYPGKDIIDEICNAADSLLAEHHPCRFIAAVNEQGRRLLEYDIRAGVLKRFYVEEIDVWQMIVEALETFERNKEALAKDPRSQRSLEKLQLLFKDPEPYGKTDGILEHVVAAKQVNDEIAERQTVAAREQGLAQIRQMVSRLTRSLNDVNAPLDLRNQALFPIQATGKAIQRADSVRAVDELLALAADQLDLAMDMILA
jgi:hypothetical protein